MQCLESGAPIVGNDDALEMSEQIDL